MKQILFPSRFWLYAIVALWVFFALGAGLWLVVGILKYWGLAKDAAAWVQAVGSIVAILASVQIARTADRRAERIQVERDQVQQQVVARIIEAVQADVASLRNDLPILTERKDWTQVQVVMSSTMDTLNAVDVVLFRSPELVRSFLYIRNNMRRVLNFVQILLREPENKGAAMTLSLHCDMVFDSARKMLNAIDGR